MINVTIYYHSNKPQVIIKLNSSVNKEHVSLKDSYYILTGSAWAQVNESR